MPAFSQASRWLALLLLLGAAPALAQDDASTYSDAELVSGRAAVRLPEGIAAGAILLVVIYSN